jgi:hypothetical protein
MESEKSKVKGWIFLSLWAVLILIGIVEKRIYGHPDLMVFFHLPAAVCLVLAWCFLSRNIRAKYREELNKRGIKSGQSLQLESRGNG